MIHYYHLEMNLYQNIENKQNKQGNLLFLCFFGIIKRCKKKGVYLWQ